MSPRTPRKDLSLKWLELFQICARNGSLQAASRETGLSVSTVSHHISNLEEHLGVALFDHSRRPMVLTPKGQAFIRNIEDALYAIRRAKAEASSGGIAETSNLRLGTIEDFDSDIAPELAVFLSSTMQRCTLGFHTDTSHAILEMLRNRQLDLGISTSATGRLGDIQERPLLRDPFIIVLPRGVEDPLSDIVEGRSKLPLLRFSGDLIIAPQIEAQLKRVVMMAQSGFECSSNQTLMAMVAAGSGWAISTPLLYSRARRFHGQVRMHDFPGKRFSRTLAISVTPDCSQSVVDLIDRKMRELLTESVIEPLCSDAPWLRDRLELL